MSDYFLMCVGRYLMGLCAAELINSGYYIEAAIVFSAGMEE